jgi:hypothetical protein
MSKNITVDEAIAILTKARDTVGGDACLILSLTGSGIEDADVNDLVIVKEDDSRYVSVKVSHPYLPTE